MLSFLQILIFLHRIVNDCARARASMEPVARVSYLPVGPLPGAEVVRRTAQASVHAGWVSPESRFCLFRLLCVCPWSTWHLAHASAPTFTPFGTPILETLSGMLAVTFDRTRAHHCALRPLAHAWARWAGSAILAICNVWASAFTDSPFLQTVS